MIYIGTEDRDLKDRNTGTARVTDVYALDKHIWPNAEPEPDPEKPEEPPKPSGPLLDIIWLRFKWYADTGANNFALSAKVETVIEGLDSLNTEIGKCLTASAGYRDSTKTQPYLYWGGDCNVPGEEHLIFDVTKIKSRVGTSKVPDDIVLTVKGGWVNEPGKSGNVYVANTGYAKGDIVKGFEVEDSKLLFTVDNDCEIHSTDPEGNVFVFNSNSDTGENSMKVGEAVLLDDNHWEFIEPLTDRIPNRDDLVLIRQFSVDGQVWKSKTGEIVVHSTKHQVWNGQINIDGKIYTQYNAWVENLSGLVLTNRVAVILKDYDKVTVLGELKTLISKSHSLVVSNGTRVSSGTGVEQTFGVEGIEGTNNPVTKEICKVTWHKGTFKVTTP